MIIINPKPTQSHKRPPENLRASFLTAARAGPELRGFLTERWRVNEEEASEVDSAFEEEVHLCRSVSGFNNPCQSNININKTLIFTTFICLHCKKSALQNKNKRTKMEKVWAKWSFTKIF